MRSDRKLVLIGAGDFAREVIWACSEIPPEDRDWVVSGLLDDNPELVRQRMSQTGVAIPILGRVCDYEPTTDECYLCAIGNPEAKLSVCESLAERGAEFVSVVHPSASVADNATVGNGAIILRHVIVSVGVSLGKYVTINNHSGLGHDVVVGDGTTISSFCDVTGHARLGRGVFLGSHAVVLPSAQAGDFATVGAGSVLMRKVEPRGTVFGVPAKSIRFR